MSSRATANNNNKVPPVTSEIATRAILNLREKLPKTNQLRREIEKVMGLETGCLEKFKDSIKPLCEKAIRDINTSLVEALQRTFKSHASSRRKTVEMDTLLRDLEEQFKWKKGDADFFRDDVVALGKQNGVEVVVVSSSSASSPPPTTTTTTKEKTKKKENIKPVVPAPKRQKTSASVLKSASPPAEVEVEEMEVKEDTEEDQDEEDDPSSTKAAKSAKGKKHVAAAAPTSVPPEPAPTSKKSNNNNKLKKQEVGAVVPANPATTTKKPRVVASTITQALVSNAIAALSVAKQGTTVKVTPKEIRREIERSLGWEEGEAEQFKPHISALIAQYDAPPPPPVQAQSKVARATGKPSPSDASLVDEYIVRRAVGDLRAVSSAMSTKQVRRKVEELLSWETGRADAIKDRVSQLIQEIVSGEAEGEPAATSSSSSSSSSKPSSQQLEVSLAALDDDSVSRAVEAVLLADSRDKDRPPVLFDVLRELERQHHLHPRSLVERHRDAAEELVRRALDRRLAKEQPSDLLLQCLQLCTPPARASELEAACARAVEPLGRVLDSLASSVGRHSYLAPPPPSKLHYVFHAMVRAVAARRVLIHSAGEERLKTAHCVLFLGTDAAENKTLVVVSCAEMEGLGGRSGHDDERDDDDDDAAPPTEWSHTRSHACLSSPLELIDDFDRDLVSEVRVFLGPSLAFAVRFVLCGEYVVFTNEPLQQQPQSSSSSSSR